MRAARSEGEGVEGKRDGRVGRERAALLPRLSEGSLVQLRPDGSDCLSVHLREPRAQTSAELLVQVLRPGEKPGGRPRSPDHGENAGNPGEPPCDSNRIVQIAVNAMALVEHRDGVADPTLVNSDHRECTQGRCFDVLVAKRTRPTEVVLVQGSAAFAVAEPVAHPREHASRRQREFTAAGIAKTG